MANVTANTLTNTATGIGYWEKTVRDTTVDDISIAKDIGHVRLNYSRLNVIGALSKGDKEDWYKFNVISQGNMRLSVRTASTGEEANESLSEDQELEDISNELRAKNMKFEVYRYEGGRLKLFASNEAKEGTKEYDRFEGLINGELRMKNADKGNYFIKLSRLDGKASDTEEPYALQVQMGDTRKHDYMTIEAAAKSYTAKSTDSDYTGPDSSLVGIGNIKSSTMTALMMAQQSAASLLETGAKNLLTIRGEQNLKSQGISTGIFNSLV